MCLTCKMSVSECMKNKLASNDEEWPSILNLVRTEFTNNSNLTVDLASRLQKVKEMGVETTTKLTMLTEELSYLREELVKSREREADVVFHQSIPTPINTSGYIRPTQDRPRPTNQTSEPEEYKNNEENRQYKDDKLTEDDALTRTKTFLK